MIKYNLDALTFRVCYDTIKAYDQQFRRNICAAYPLFLNFRSMEPGTARERRNQ